MQVIVDQEKCIGCGFCCELCGSVFRMNNDGKAEGYQKPNSENMADAQSAIDGCPVAAISWGD